MPDETSVVGDVGLAMADRVLRRDKEVVVFEVNGNEVSYFTLWRLLGHEPCCPLGTLPGKLGHAMFECVDALRHHTPPQ